MNSQRDIMLMNIINEAPDIEGPTIQHTKMPSEDAALAAAFVLDRFDVGAPVPFYACCMVTVLANALVATPQTDRIPAFLAAKDWPTWLGEKPATVEQVKAYLRTAGCVK